MTREEIIKELEKSFDRVIDWLRQQEDHLFDQGPSGKWVTSQQLDHIHKSSKAINRGMGFPKLALRWKFGIANRPSRSFEELDTKYKTKIKNMPKDFEQPMVPKIYAPDQKSQRLMSYRKVADRMIGNAKKWSEKNLDKYILPHPAIGKITIREFLMWTIIHNDWHLKSLKEDYI